MFYFAFDLKSVSVITQALGMLPANVSGPVLDDMQAQVDDQLAGDDYTDDDESELSDVSSDLAD